MKCATEKGSPRNTPNTQKRTDGVGQVGTNHIRCLTLPVFSLSVCSVDKITSLASAIARGSAVGGFMHGTMFVEIALGPSGPGVGDSDSKSQSPAPPDERVVNFSRTVHLL